MYSLQGGYYFYSLSCSFLLQSTLEKLTKLSKRVSSDVSRGKELHANEQAPAFLYTDVTRLEKCWAKLEDAAEQCYDHILVRYCFT